MAATHKHDPEKPLFVLNEAESAIVLRGTNYTGFIFKNCNEVWLDGCFIATVQKLRMISDSAMAGFVAHRLAKAKEKADAERK